jgi:hypothetical protein
VNSWLFVNSWHKSWFDQVFATLAPGQPWKQNHIEISCDWLYQNTGLALTQFLLYRDCTASALRVCFESWFLAFDLDSLNVYHWGVGPTCQWTIIRWMTHHEISLLNLLRVINLEWTRGGRAFIPSVHCLEFPCGTNKFFPKLSSDFFRLVDPLSCLSLLFLMIYY